MAPTPDARSTIDAQPVLFDVQLPSDHFAQEAAEVYTEHLALVSPAPLVPVGSVVNLTAERSRRRFTEEA